MKILYSICRYCFSGHFAAFASAASLISLFIYFVPQPWAVITALLAFIAFLIGLFIRSAFILNRFLAAETKDGYLKLATYVNYSTSDGNHIHYTLHKYIQCKQLIMDTHHHDYKWTGTIEGSISSTQQDYISSLPPIERSESYKAVLRFKKPLIYNETALVEFIMHMDDSDHRSKKFCAQIVKENIHLISFNVDLKHLTSCNDAKIVRRRLNVDIVAEDSIIAFVPFDESTRSFSYNLFNPDLGYNYRLDWSS